MTPIAPLITAFLREYMPSERGYSVHTCETYAHAFRLLFVFASERLRVPSALEQVMRIRAIPTKRYDQALVRHLTTGEVRAILDAPDLTARLGIRDRAMLHLCFACGLRVSELVGLPLAHLVLHPRRRKERCLPLWKETAVDLRAWLAVRGPAQVPELFVNAEGNPMTRAGFEYILDKHTRSAAVKCSGLAGCSVSPHQLRHSCAVMMLQATRDIRKVALWLGHADVRTTEIYLRLDPSEKLEAVEAVLPPTLRRGRFKAPDALIASLLEPRRSGHAIGPLS